jgi:hypothetical protein
MVGTEGIVDVARAATAGAALRSWGDALGSAADDLARGLRSEIPRSVPEGLGELRTVSSGSVHATGWELRGAFNWRNDDRCIQRAALGAMSLVEREAGDLRAGFGDLATNDARRAAIAVNYTPNFSSSMGRARLHAAPVFRTHEGETLVIDHLFADAEDGVLTLQDWLRRTGGTERSTRIVGALHMPPLSPGGSAGIPAFAKVHDGAEWRAFGDHLASAWQEAADRHLPAYQRMR